MDLEPIAIAGVHRLDHAVASREGVHLPPVRAPAQLVERVLVGRHELEAALAARELDQLDHHGVVSAHHRHVGGGGLDEPERDRRALVDVADPPALLGDRDDPFDRLDVAPVRGDANLARVGGEDVGGADVQDLVADLVVLVLDERADGVLEEER